MKTIKLKTKIFPPAVASVFLILMTALKYALPQTNISLGYSNTLAITTFLIGLSLIISANISFARANTTINPFKPETATALVTSGVFAISRNPMYLGLTLILFGWGMFLSNIVSFATVIAFIFYIKAFQIKPEEKAMKKLFGEEYLKYKTRVRRWV